MVFPSIFWPWRFSSRGGMPRGGDAACCPRARRVPYQRETAYLLLQKSQQDTERYWWFLVFPPEKYFPFISTNPTQPITLRQVDSQYFSVGFFPLLWKNCVQKFLQLYSGIVVCCLLLLLLFFVCVMIIIDRRRIPDFVQGESYKIDKRCLFFYGLHR